MTATEQRGPIAWMAKNHVTANILMIVFLVGGLFTTSRIKQEVFPDFDLDLVTVTIAYPGASPEEVEQGIVLVVEEAIRGISEIKEVTAVAREGAGTITAELQTGVNAQKAYQEIDQEVARIVTFPLDAEEPRVSLVTRRRLVTQLTLYGDVDEWVLREISEETRDRLLALPGITQVDLAGVRDYEIHAEISREELRAYGLSLDGVARILSEAALELPGGSVKTEGGEILLRVKERRDWAREFAELPVITTPGGGVVRLGDIATVREGFEEANRERRFEGFPCVDLEIYRVGDQTPLGVAAAVHEAMEDLTAGLPPGVNLSVTEDRSEIYGQRLHLLLRNAFLGLILVLVVLGLFLELRLAFWVTMGIPVSFLGGLLFLPGLGVTINMISMFAFIVALGIVVDDAIVAGENIYEYRRKGMNFLDAAIRGAREVAMPISFSILTNIVAFLPLALIPGVMGKIWITIPIVVITVFLVSWVEALFILPAHLAYSPPEGYGKVMRRIERWQRSFAARVDRFIHGRYAPFLDWTLHHRRITVAIGLAVLLLVLSYVKSGRMGMVLMPKVESDYAIATAVLPYGTPMDRAREVRDRMQKAARRVIDAHGGERLAEGVLGDIEENRVEVTVYLTDPDVRPLGTSAFSSFWREETGQIPGLEMLRFESDRGGPGSGASLTVELAHRDIDALDRASTDLAARLDEFAYTKDIDDGYSPGKEQLDFRIRPEGRALGLNADDVARQVRSAFYGSQAIRQQRGRNEVRVLVRLPEEQRTRESDVEKLMVRTPAGIWVPLMEIADVERGRAYTTITRRNGRRTVQVTCNVEPFEKTSTVQADLDRETLPALAKDHPGLQYAYEGRQADMKESMSSLVGGFALALLAAYALLAIPFRSYTQPLVVMISIPFGIVGAVIGHYIMGYSLSVMSMMGIVALSGVVINDSLVLIDKANRLRSEGVPKVEAIHQAGVRRFRPILLTTLTTFGGLSPMIFETSRQARFMIPMALSLGYGILFATGITLVLVPSLYLLVEELMEKGRALLTRGRGGSVEAA
ncbi:MAG: efflux RND transporter permease subunit [Candidatus Eisenbacteria bacterium]|nr:efflux RND transporter permease subunit [Candidatus Eisenbacteria bacterium]